MNKAIFALLFALGFCATDAQAGDQPTYEVGYASHAVTGVRCSTGTAIQINSTRPTGFKANVAGYRIGNQCSSSIWLGNINVSTGTVVGDSLTNLGEQVGAGASAPYSFGKSYLTTSVPLIPIYCKAADGAGSAGCVISVLWHGY
jgi:hypothetical protein